MAADDIQQVEDELSASGHLYQQAGGIRAGGHTT